VSSVRTRIADTLPLLVVAVLYALVTGSPVVPGIVLVAALVALVVSPYIDAPPFVQRATLLVVGLFTVTGGVSALEAGEPEVPSHPGRILGGVAITTLFLVATRRFFREPEWGPRVELGLLTLAMLACGQRRIGPSYVALALLFVALVLAMLRARDTESGWLWVEMRSPLAGAALLFLVAGSAAAGMVVLPRLSRLTQRQFDRYVIPHGPAQVGYVDRIRTGSSDALVESDTMVLRVYGPHVDYLRGRVYDTYDRGSWENSRATPPRRVSTLSGTPDGATVVELRAVGEMRRASHLARFFVPLGAHRFATTKGVAEVDDLGALRPAPDEPPTPIAFELGAADYAPLAPVEADLRILDEKTRASAFAHAREWTSGAESDLSKLLALEHHLSHDFAYSLDGVPPSRDPSIVQFLDHTHRGRCELFATAMALAARSVGIPARVVGGFRVAEHNQVGGYDVVREKNAHAWVEAWVDGAWRTFDPTPSTETNRRHDESAANALGDSILAAWDRALDVLARAALWQFGVGLGGAVMLLTIVRVLRARRERKARELAPTEGPLVWFSHVLALLAHEGHPRAPSEPLERYAARLEQAGRADSARLVLDYAAFRYGGIGDAAALARRCREATAQMRLPAHA
jgi:transglutaminase-like putative cysteine protease